MLRATVGMRDVVSARFRCEEEPLLAQRLCERRRLAVVAEPAPPTVTRGKDPHTLEVIRVQPGDSLQNDADGIN